MKSFIEWMEGRDDYNNSGVPYYADSNTPSNRSPDYSSSYKPLVPAMSKSKSEAFVNKRFKVVPGGLLASKYGDEATGIITKVGPQNFTYNIDGVKGNFTHSSRSLPYVLYSHLEDSDDPYIFVKSPNHKLSFDGIRIYEIGDMVAYRIQKEEKTQPFGKSYWLDVEDMFNDYMSENIKEEDAGKRVVESIIDEVKKFFSRSSKAEEEIRDSGQDGTGLIIKTGGTDYSTTVLNRV